MHIENTDFFAYTIQVIRRLAGCFIHGAHADDDPFGIHGTMIIEETVVPAGQLVHFFHITFDNFRNSIVISVCRFLCLEKDVRILSRSPQCRMVRAEAAVPECFQSILIEQFREVVISLNLDFLDFMRSPETVKEMQERYAPFDGRQMGDRGQIRGFLNAGRSQHRIASLPAGHHIRMVPEDGKRMPPHCPGGNMDDGRQQLSGHFIQVWHHQQ